MAYYAYLRVSTEEQADSGLGLEAQLESCKEHIRRSGGSLSEVFTDEGISGSKGLDKRIGLLTALQSLSKGDTLVVAKRDRLGRDVLIVASIEAGVERSGARIESAAGEGNGDGPGDLLMRRMIDAFAEYERLIISCRTKAALAAKKARGERLGSAPYGYKQTPGSEKLEEHQEEQRCIAAILAYREKGYNYSRIATEIDTDGFRSRGKSGKWYAQSVKNIILANTISSDNSK